MNALGFTHCAGCGSVVVAKTGDVENYMVHDDVWAQARLDGNDGFLCAACLEVRLGRPLMGADLALDCMVNYPGQQRDTPQMFQLKSEAWDAAGSYVPPWMEQQQAVLTKLLAMAAAREAM